MNDIVKLNANYLFEKLQDFRGLSNGRVIYAIPIAAVGVLATSIVGVTLLIESVARGVFQLAKCMIYPRDFKNSFKIGCEYLFGGIIVFLFQTIVLEIKFLISPFMQRKKRLILQKIKEGCFYVPNLNFYFRDDKQIFLAALQNPTKKYYYDLLQFASYNIRNDKKIILACVQQNECALYYASDRLKNDKKVVLAAVQQDGRALIDASDRLKNDEDIVLVAVQKNGWALDFASDVYKNDKDVVLAAVKQNGRALNFASDRLKDDKEFVLTAVKQNEHAFQYARDRFKDDEDVVLAAVKQNGLALQYASDVHKNNKEVVLAAVKQNGHAFQYASSVLCMDDDIIFSAWEKNPDFLRFFEVYNFNDQIQRNLIQGKLNTSIVRNGFLRNVAKEKIRTQRNDPNIEAAIELLPKHIKEELT